MDNKQYLEQISSEARPLKSSKKLFGLNISPKMLKIIIGALIATIAIFIFGSIISSNNNNNTERDYLDQIYLRTDNLMGVIDDYNKLVKSSELRSMGTSLNAVLAEINYRVTTYLKEELGLSSVGKPEKETILTEETELTEELEQNLENGRLNGILDRTYAREFTYQIGMLIVLEMETSSHTKNEDLKSYLESSEVNLDKLYDQFNSFSAN